MADTIDLAAFRRTHVVRQAPPVPSAPDDDPSVARIADVLLAVEAVDGRGLTLTALLDLDDGEGRIGMRCAGEVWWLDAYEAREVAVALRDDAETPVDRLLAAGFDAAADRADELEAAARGTPPPPPAPAAAEPSTEFIVPLSARHGPAPAFGHRLFGWLVANPSNAAALLVAIACGAAGAAVPG